MPEIPLQHCNPVVVWDGPCADVDLTFVIGGDPATGHVSVTAGEGELDAPVDLPTGSSGTIRLPRVTCVRLHYHAGDGGTPECAVTANPTPVPVL